MKNRLFANYTTTAMGIILILGSMVAVFTKIAPDRDWETIYFS